MLEKEEASIPYYHADFLEKALCEESFIENAAVVYFMVEKYSQRVVLKHTHKSYRLYNYSVKYYAVQRLPASKQVTI